MLPSFPVWPVYCLSPSSRANDVSNPGNEVLSSWVAHIKWKAPFPFGSGLNTQDGNSWSAGTSHSGGGASAWATFTRETSNTAHSVVAIIFDYEVTFEWTNPNIAPTMLTATITNTATASAGFGTSFYDKDGLKSTGAEASATNPTVEEQTYTSPDPTVPPTDSKTYTIAPGTDILVIARYQEALAGMASFGSTIETAWKYSDTLRIVEDVPEG